MSNYPFVRLTVEAHFQRLYANAIIVSWVLDRGFAQRAPGPYRFTLRRHQTATDDRPVDVAKAIDVYSLEDRSPRQGQYEEALSYSVVLTDGDGKTYTSQVQPVGSYWSHQDWLVAREIIRKEAMLLRKKAGTKGILLKRRQWGDACTVCTDPTTGQVRDPGCGTCFGTGIEGGYYPGQECWVLMNQTKRAQRLTVDQGLVTANDETVRALAYPVLEVNDIWVHRPTNNRYRIMEDIAAIVRWRGVDLVMNARLDLLPSSSSVYNFPVT